MNIGPLEILALILAIAAACAYVSLRKRVGRAADRESDPRPGPRR